MVTMTTDSKGVTEALVTADSAGLEVSCFVLDPRIVLFLGNSPDIGLVRQND